MRRGFLSPPDPIERKKEYEAKDKLNFERNTDEPDTIITPSPLRPNRVFSTRSRIAHRFPDRSMSDFHTTYVDDRWGRRRGGGDVDEVRVGLEVRLMKRRKKKEVRGGGERRTRNAVATREEEKYRHRCKEECSITDHMCDRTRSIRRACILLSTLQNERRGTFDACHRVRCTTSFELRMGWVRVRRGR
ncbi:hypothetical protein SCHPADRAFT_246185 [Schizopora paradoxa]|uniref:Uncharacterized protein n=1 Tax=Schizopora paradoxa TaxID=27342 RepID=A0A0H2SFJ3_9AGAM|nr:hypothetical protein SCHPADRAFT_246185 [Schizopora paradoxa]